MTYFTDVQENEWRKFSIDDNFRWVLLVIIIQLFHYFYCVLKAGSPRRHIFTQEFMDDNFKTEHAESGIKDPLMKGGYPDAGSGRYIMKAGYKAWVEFNTAQRIHIQYMEAVTQMMCLQLFTGLYFPMTTVVIGVIYLIGRVIFTWGYTSGGPKGRMYGAPLVLLTQMLLPIFSIVAMFYLAKSGQERSVVTQSATFKSGMQSAETSSAGTSEGWERASSGGSGW